jgi:hypothetical protein
MTRRTFFIFFYERDGWRAGQVRNCWVTQDREVAGFWDAAAWESVKKKGERMSFTIRSEDNLVIPDFWLISTPRWLR